MSVVVFSHEDYWELMLGPNPNRGVLFIPKTVISEDANEDEVLQGIIDYLEGGNEL